MRPQLHQTIIRLVALEAHTSHDEPVRRLEISKQSMGGYHAGLNKKDVRPFTSEKIGDGVFKVTPAPLKPGEYAFVQLEGARAMVVLKMFDFRDRGAAANKRFRLGSERLSSNQMDLNCPVCAADLITEPSVVSPHLKEKMPDGHTMRTTTFVHRQSKCKKLRILPIRVWLHAG